MRCSGRLAHTGRRGHTAGLAVAQGLVGLDLAPVVRLADLVGQASSTAPQDQGITATATAQGTGMDPALALASLTVLRRSMVGRSHRTGHHRDRHTARHTARRLGGRASFTLTAGRPCTCDRAWARPMARPMDHMAGRQGPASSLRRGLAASAAEIGIGIATGTGSEIETAAGLASAHTAAHTALAVARRILVARAMMALLVARRPMAPARPAATTMVVQCAVAAQADSARHRRARDRLCLGCSAATTAPRHSRPQLSLVRCGRRRTRSDRLELLPRLRSSRRKSPASLLPPCCTLSTLKALFECKALI